MARRAGIAQLVEQLICNHQVAGSTPVLGSIKLNIFGDVAQLGEQLPCTHQVAGSTPVISTISACSAVWLAHLLWEQGVVGSNPTTPTILQRRKNE